MSSLEISVAAGGSGRVMVLAGEADLTSITQLDEALDAQLSGQIAQLTIDVSKLRYADSSSIRALAAAAVILRYRGGNLVLVRPQPSILKMLSILGADHMLTILGDTATTARPHRDAERSPQLARSQALCGQLQARGKHCCVSAGIG